MGQLQLPLYNVALVDDEIVGRQPNLTRAIIVCADMAGMEDKQAADAAGVDPATWSKIKTGLANFPASRFTQYQQRCGNWLPLQWQAREAGFGLVRLESEMQRRLRESEEAQAKAEAENKLLRDILQGRAK